MSQLNLFEQTQPVPEDGFPDVFQHGTAEPEPITQAEPPPEEKPKWQLKKLTGRHKQIVALKAQGMGRTEIAVMCKCTPEYITMLMEQPLILELLSKHSQMVDRDLADLTGKAVNVTRSMMESSDDKVKLSAAFGVLKMNGKMTPKDDDDKMSAEDVVAGIFKIANSQVQININSKE